MRTGARRRRAGRGGVANGFGSEGGRTANVTQHCLVPPLKKEGKQDAPANLLDPVSRSTDNGAAAEGPNHGETDGKQAAIPCGTLANLNSHCTQSLTSKLECSWPWTPWSSRQGSPATPKKRRRFMLQMRQRRSLKHQHRLQTKKPMPRRQTQTGCSPARIRQWIISWNNVFLFHQIS